MIHLSDKKINISLEILRLFYGLVGILSVVMMILILYKSISYLIILFILSLYHFYNKYMEVTDEIVKYYYLNDDIARYLRSNHRNLNTIPFYTHKIYMSRGKDIREVPFNKFMQYLTGENVGLNLYGESEYLIKKYNENKSMDDVVLYYDKFRKQAVSFDIFYNYMATFMVHGESNQIPNYENYIRFEDVYNKNNLDNYLKIKESM